MQQNTPKKIEYGIIAVSLALGLLVWVIDALLDYFYFYEGRSLLGLLIFEVPAHELCIRTLIVVFFLTFGFYISKIVAGCRHKEEAFRSRAEELEEVNRLKGIFADVMRHDLLNPTGVIMNLTEILGEDENLKDSAEIVVIKRNAKKLEDIIEAASMYGKLESPQDLEKERLDLGELVTKAIDALGMHSLAKGTKIEFNGSEKHKINVSPMLVSAIENLLSNAIKYGPDGQTIKIAISDAGDNLKVSIKDQGEGVPDEFKEAIFDRFTRKDKLGVRGTGLGLAIVKRIVELHDGRVWVEDPPEGKGSVFFVELPKG